MATALGLGARSGLRLLSAGAEAASATSSRAFHSTGTRRMGAHAHDEPYYVHAKHMYNLHRMKHQQLKVCLAVLAAVGTGIGVPVYAVVFQQKKTASA
ncbi:hypothetical protein Zm00014a_007914 [Zea mays]|uniref:SLL1 protein n=2 Tax=Zea mays TaxID=4577 RepID=B6SMM6_MAIZE|nr:uncharacterized protein LOC100276974 isoform 1 [Zea mays]ACG26109.1 hypothetical protein [Zea mays]ACG38102.1 hypothetical protein [Zea mays]AQK71636.1 SLL1 protein [Zea mays]PWZ22804.1 hypothetical protein Zm00014a_007914 [Zea mays]|eukprot:NP_001144129.1 uncharacterized protein LOC100276974 [Zea mays]